MAKSTISAHFNQCSILWVHQFFTQTTVTEYITGKSPERTMSKPGYRVLYIVTLYQKITQTHNPVCLLYLQY